MGMNICAVTPLIGISGTHTLGVFCVRRFYQRRVDPIQRRIYTCARCVAERISGLKHIPTSFQVWPNRLCYKLKYVDMLSMGEVCYTVAVNWARVCAERDCNVGGYMTDNEE